MSIASGKYYGLDPIAEKIWNLLAKPRRAGEICDWLQERYQVEREQCEADVLALLQQMLREKLIIIQPGNAES